MANRNVLGLAVLCVVLTAIELYASEKESVKPLIETKRLGLRQFTLADTDDLYEVMSNTEVMRFSGSGPRNWDQTHEYIKGLLEHYRMHGFGKWAVVSKAMSKVIGICGLQKGMVNDQPVVEMGYRLSRPFWGNGIITEANAGVLDYAFTKLKLPEIVSCIEPENLASIKVAEHNHLCYWKDGHFLGKTCRVYRILIDDYLKAQSCKLP